MYESRFYQGQIKLAHTLDRPGALLDAETTLAEAATQLAESGYRSALVQDEHGAIAGVVSRDVVEQRLTQSIDGNEPAWQSRSVEMLSESRCLTRGRTGPSAEETQQDVACTPVFEDGRLIAVMTPDDVLISWERMDLLLRTATTDQLTGLMNRHTFTKRLGDELARSERTKEPISLLLIDLDWFKEINDQEGHLVGDAVLTEVGACLWNTLRRCDAVARFGGDEFAALCCACSADNIAAPIRRLRNAVQEIEVPSRRPRPVSLSIGAACVAADFDTLTDTQLFKIADSALYAAKANGRGTAFYSVVGTGTDLPARRVEIDVAHHSEEVAAVY